MKSFQEQNYPHTARVAVTLPGTDYVLEETFQDEIKGLNEGHALARARWNWPEASKIEVVG